jgi:hypothetical protein
MARRLILLPLLLASLLVMLPACRIRPGSRAARIAQVLGKGGTASASAESSATKATGAAGTVGTVKPTTPPTKAPAEHATARKAVDAPASGRVLFTRDGNVHLIRLKTGEEMQITNQGVPEEDAGVHYGAPTWVDNESLAMLRWETNANGRIVKRAIEFGVIQSESDTISEAKRPTGLGYSTGLSKLLYLEQTGQGGGAEDDFGAELALFTFAKSGKPERTKLTSWFGDTSLGHARIRASAKGDLVSLPRFPTDVSDFYGINRFSSGAAVDVIPERYLGQAFVTGIDFGQKAAYATIMVLDNSIEMGPGLYRLDLSTREHEQIAMQSNLYGLAVSEPLGIAVVANDSGDLSVMQLVGGDETPLGSGADPDIWPR